MASRAASNYRGRWRGDASSSPNKARLARGLTNFAFKFASLNYTDAFFQGPRRVDEVLSYLGVPFDIG